MDVKTVQGIASSEYVFGILFIIGLIVAFRVINAWIKDTKSESKERELKLEKLYEEHKVESLQREKDLMQHLEKSNESLERTSRTLDKIEFSLQSLENKTEKMDIGINDIWKRLEEIDNKKINEH
ncbi:hypothetical protein [Heyndrickxia camelliae]|uniref:Uncharacterized protein n=1 Tax=Heyndrickxia camelliae TaxID=1707093 RepID=A0A2N3LD99_9BACI|nr:hypothetical protein [Heyndrickxia camelliae]PKR82598.1 hypothetical protein CWO92_23485 [Heyndrickxia camelliae]